MPSFERTWHKEGIKYFRYVYRLSSLKKDAIQMFVWFSDMHYTLVDSSPLFHSYIYLSSSYLRQDEDSSQYVQVANVSWHTVALQLELFVSLFFFCFLTSNLVFHVVCSCFHFFPGASRSSTATVWLFIFKLQVHLIFFLFSALMAMALLSYWVLICKYQDCFLCSEHFNWHFHIHFLWNVTN